MVENGTGDVPCDVLSSNEMTVGGLFEFIRVEKGTIRPWRIPKLAGSINLTLSPTGQKYGYLRQSVAKVFVNRILKAYGVG